MSGKETEPTTLSVTVPANVNRLFEDFRAFIGQEFDCHSTKEFVELVIKDHLPWWILAHLPYPEYDREQVRVKYGIEENNAFPITTPDYHSATHLLDTTFKHAANAPTQHESH